MAVVDASTAAQRWQASAATAQQRFAEGVQATTADVVGLAIAAQGALLQNFQQAVTSGRWQRRLQETGTQGWKQATVAKANNYATGINASGNKYQTAYADMLPTMQSLQAQIEGMPSGTIDASIARSAAWQTGMHNWKLSQ